jgi:chemotaxis protein methyltransferase WspC
MNSPVPEVVSLIRDWTGIIVREHHFPLIESELISLGKDGGIRHGADLVLRGDVRAREHMVSVITNPETYLFRHFGHFDALSEFARKRVVDGKPCRVLSAGCSSGEEAWSAAAVLGSVYLLLGRLDFSVTGWDIDHLRLGRAVEALFGSWAMRDGLHGYDAFFEKKEHRRKIRDKLRPFVRFEAANLVSEELPSKSTFDVIFFRNVAIYWSRPVALRVLNSLANLLSEDGMLFVGPSDPLGLDSQLWSCDMNSSVPIIRRATRAREVAETVRPHPRREPERRRQRSDRAKAAVAHVRKKEPRPVERPRQQVPDATTPKPWLETVKELANTGKYEEALSILREQKTRLAPPERLWEGILLLNMGCEQEAVRVFRQCVYFEPNDPVYRRWLAAALDALGQNIDAAREYRNASQLEVQQ